MSNLLHRGNNPVGSTRDCSGPFLQPANTVGWYTPCRGSLSYTTPSAGTTASQYTCCRT